MFEKFLTQNADTFRQRYEGTFGFYRDENGKRLLTKLTSIARNVCTFVDAKGVEYKLYADAEKNIGFEFIPPRAAYYNTDQGAYLVKRSAARQFQRGITSRNIAIYQLHKKNQMYPATVDFDTLERVYLKAIATQDAVKLWDKLPSIAISKQIALGDSIVYLYENKIGTYEKKGTHLMVKLEEPSLWRTEVMDAVRGAGCTAEVT